MGFTDPFKYFTDGEYVDNLVYCGTEERLMEVEEHDHVNHDSDHDVDCISSHNSFN